MCAEATRARDLRGASTEAEAKLWRALRNRALDGRKFRRQHPVGKYFADFAWVEAGLMVELDGGQHFDPAAVVADRVRTAAIERAGFRVLRFDNRQALTQTEEVLTAIRQWLTAHSPHPCPLPQAGEGAPPDKATNRSPLPLAGEG